MNEGFFIEATMNEEAELRPIPDFPKYYTNDLGEIWSSKLKHKGLVRLKPYIGIGGYLYIKLQKNKKQHSKKVSRLVMGHPKTCLLITEIE